MQNNVLNQTPLKAGLLRMFPTSYTNFSKHKSTFLHTNIKFLQIFKSGKTKNCPMLPQRQNTKLVHGSSPFPPLLPTFCQLNSVADPDRKLRIGLHAGGGGGGGLFCLP